VRGGHHASALLGNQRDPVPDPPDDDELAGLSLELAHETLPRHRHTPHHGCDVRIDEGGDLLAVTGQTRYRAVPDHRTATSVPGPAPV
jgi:hypothetical protein